MWSIYLAVHDNIRKTSVIDIRLRQIGICFYCFLSRVWLFYRNIPNNIFNKIITNVKIYGQEL